jgi:hypothetical protein
MKHILLILLVSFTAEANISTTNLSANELRFQRKIGLGGQLLGSSGAVGAIIDMNFHPRWGLNIGYGQAADFQSFQVEYKHILYGERILSYGVLGVTRWFGENDDSIESTNPGFLAEKLMSAKDRREGEINENLMYPGVGVQYINTSGAWTGFSLFGQVILLIDIQDFVFVPTLGIGSIYYF